MKVKRGDILYVDLGAKYRGSVRRAAPVRWWLSATTGQINTVP